MEAFSSKRVGVCLASGYFGFFAHAGFVAALEGIGLVPSALSGASAGALVGAMWAAGMDAAAIREAVLGIGVLDLVDLPRPWDLAGRPGGLIRGERMQRKLEEMLPVGAFEQCRLPLAVTAYDLDERRLRVFDSGPLAPAVRASCALPFMFEPAPVDGHVYWDGGTVEKAPLGPLAARKDLDAIIVCYLPQSRPPGRPTTIAAGLRAALHTLILPEQQRVVDELRAGGMDVHVVAPDVPRSGPGRLSLGPRIVERAEGETRRILEERDFGCDQLT